MNTNEPSRPRHRGLWIMFVILLATALFREVALSRRLNALEKWVAAAQASHSSNENRPATNDPEMARSELVGETRSSFRRPRSGNDSQLSTERQEQMISNNLETRLVSLETHLQKLSNGLALSTNGSIIPEYDPANPPPDTGNAEAQKTQDRDWGPEQVIGPPNAAAGDDPKAWAPLKANAGPEWLWINFGQPAEVAEVRVRENHNPGAIWKVSGMIGQQEVVLWEGVAAKGSAPRDFVVRPRAGIVLQAVVVHLDTARFSDWAEVDAVELVGRDGSRQWAVSANASSSYAEAVSAGQEF